MRCSLPRSLSLLFFLNLFAAAPVLAAPSWTPLGPFGGTIETLTVAPSDARVLYATIPYEGAFRSTDGGASWTPIHSAFIDSNVAVDPVRPGTLYLSTPASRLVKSTDFGSHWTPASRGLEEAGVSAVAVDPARPSRIYAAVGLRVFRSTNGGSSWQGSSQELPNSFDPRVQLLAVSRPRGTVFALTGGRLFRSTDAGMTWNALGGGLPEGVLTVAASPTEPWVLYASARAIRGSGLYRSRDSGTSWEAVRSTASPVVTLAVSPRSSRTVWAGTESRGLLVSHDGGFHWKAAGPREAAQEISGITAVAVPASSPGTVFAALRPNGTDPGGIFASQDGGTTWERRNRSLAGLEAPRVLVDPFHPGVIWTSRTGQGLFRSADGGRGWTFVPVPMPGTGLAMAPSAPSTLYVLDTQRTWRTDDDGATWTAVEGSGAPPWPTGGLWVDPLSPTTLWSNGNNLVKSVDGGATWLRQPLPSPGWVRHLAFAPSSPSTMYAVGVTILSGKFTRATAWRSLDGGATWASIQQGLGGNEPTALAIDPVDSRLVYVGVCGSGCSPRGGIWKTADGGASWNLIGQGLESREVTALAASPIAGTVWLAMENGRIFRSRDGGETWQERPGPQARVVYDLILDPQNPRRVYAGTSSGVWVLDDR